MECNFGSKVRLSGKYTCTVCGRQIKSSGSPSDIHATCRGERESQGLGDTVAKVAGFFGFKPCQGCNRRRERLNRWWPYKKT